MHKCFKCGEVAYVRHTDDEWICDDCLKEVELKAHHERVFQSMKDRGVG